MKRILVVAQFTQLPGESGNNRSRFKYICELLSTCGYQVTQVTSRFRDLDKVQRKLTSDQFENIPYDIQILEDPGYKKTVSLKRFYSQKVFARNLKKWLSTQDGYDLIYCSGPPAEGMLVAGSYANERGIPFVVDIQDLWPEAFYTIVNSKPLADLLLYPMKSQVNRAYRMADGIVGVSKTYSQRAASVNKNNPIVESVFIGTNLDDFDKSSNEVIERIEKQDNEFWVTYAGSLNLSYDIETLIRAVKILSDRDYHIVKLVILGSGIMEEKFRKLAETMQVSVLFTGWIDYGTMAAYLRKSDLLVNAIREKAAQSITNKIGDYVSAGVPIINGSKNQEFMDLVEEWDMGINYEPEKPEAMANAILEVYRESPERRKTMGQNARKLAEEKFDRKKTYLKITDLIDKLLDGQRGD
ncbi:glycosyltransferase family 4 protein [Paenibacillus xanthanilyticus]|uniref:Glycosyltransferase family 4 protein n=1 Tax=Paenibacillus xanthanilyticus TaxID=1783531 RepID=A0ABV8K327_9BACL